MNWILENWDGNSKMMSFDVLWLKVQGQLGDEPACK
jgi:hypothetical protein